MQRHKLVLRKHKIKLRLKEGLFMYKNLEEVINARNEVGIISTAYANIL